MPDKLVVVFFGCIVITAVTTFDSVASIASQKAEHRTKIGSAQMDQMLAAVQAIDEMVNQTMSSMRIFTYMNRAWITNYVKDKPHLLQNQSSFFSEWNDTLYHEWGPKIGAAGESPQGFGFNAQYFDTDGNAVSLTWQSLVDPWYDGSVYEAICASEWNNDSCVGHDVIRGDDGVPRFRPDIRYVVPQPMRWTNQSSFEEQMEAWPAGDGTSYWYLTHQSDFQLNGRHVNVQTYETTLKWPSHMAESLRSSQECVVFDSNKYPVAVYLEDGSYAAWLDRCFQTFAVNFTTIDECLMKPGDTHVNAAIRALYQEAFGSAANLSTAYDLSMEYRTILGRRKLFAMQTVVSLDRLHLHVACMENDNRPDPFEATKTALELGIPMSLLIVVMVCLAGYLNRERRIRQERDEKAAELTTNIAGAMCEYDLEYVDMLLDAYTADANHKTELVTPLRDLRSNLGEYRPYLPSYMLPEDKALVPRSSATLHESSLSSSSSSKNGSHSAYSNSTLLVRSGHGVSLNGDVCRRIALAAVDFVGSVYSVGAPKSKLTSSAAIDAAAVAVHSALAVTGGVLHCFIGDSVVASWNSAKPVQQPEKKACRFLCSLRADPALSHLQTTGAAVMGDALCHAGGDSKQRTLVVCSPAAFSLLDAARRIGQQSGAVVVHSAVRMAAKLDFKMAPYDVHDGAAYYEIIRDNSEDDGKDDGKDEEWMYRVARAENTVDEQLEKVAQQWAAGHVEDARRTLESITCDDAELVPRLSAIAMRMR